LLQPRLKADGEKSPNVVGDGRHPGEPPPQSRRRLRRPAEGGRSDRGFRPRGGAGRGAGAADGVGDADLRPEVPQTL